MSLVHDRHMRRAIQVARENEKAPFGALIVDATTGDEVATGCNCSDNDPTLHGEIDCIRKAAAVWDPGRCGDYVLYTTAEPCPMCMSACVWGGFRAVVYGTSIPYLQATGWFQIDIRSHEVAAKGGWGPDRVVGGVMEAECDRLFDAAMRLHRGG
ncbi:MAG: nucleoside deaminase [Planctomycetota bacterium]